MSRAGTALRGVGAPRRAAPVDRVMRTLARAIEGLALPAMEKISEDHQTDPFKILIGTLLSARTQDATTHAACTRLFARAPTAEALARLPLAQIERLIYPVGFYRNKARFVKEASQALLVRFGGQVPPSLDDMVTLPGVGRKTANLVMILAFASERHMCVDTHVHRISHRLGWVATRDANATERALYDVVPRRWWSRINLYLVTWGQQVCRPIAPRCGGCALAAVCPRIGVERVGTL